MAAADAAAATA
jgi:hypothetical protein